MKRTSFLAVSSKRPYMSSWVSEWSHLIVSGSLRTPWTVAHQDPQSMRFSRQEYWSGLPFSSLYVFIEPFNFSFLSITDYGIDLDDCDIEWFALEMNRDYSVVFEIASKKEMVTHSSILAWRILWLEEPCSLPSWGHKKSDTTERPHFTHYWISDSFIYYDGYSISFKVSLPTVVDIMVIWVLFTLSRPS